MLSRVADAMYWTSRYVERAVAATRLVDATLHLQLDAGSLQEEWELSDPASVSRCIHVARDLARGVRESLSSEMWEQLNTLHLWLNDSSVALQAEDNPAMFFRQVRERAQFFQGLMESTLVHGEEWNFGRLGMYVERADNVARALNLLGHLLEVERIGQYGGDETVRWMAVLRSCGSAEAYSRYYSLRVEPARVVEFLLLNPIFPQSVRFSLNTAYDALRAIAGETSQPGAPNPAVRALGHLQARLEYAAVDELIEAGLREFLEDLQGRIATASDLVTALYLSDLPIRSGPAAAERAAMIMALQQQQQQQ
jgi:uncharacterized alpha-E superfamily protein